MTPRIRFHGDAFNGTAESHHITEKRFLYDDDHEKDQQGERGRRVVRQEKCSGALHSHDQRRGQNTEGDKNCGQRLGLAVAIRMSFVGRSRRKTQSAPNHDRAGDIKRGFYSVGDQSVGISENTGGNFDDRESNIDHHADEREARPSLQIMGGSVRMRGFDEKKY
jgi:hypothetical protein